MAARIWPSSGETSHASEEGEPPTSKLNHNINRQNWCKLNLFSSAPDVSSAACCLGESWANPLVDKTHKTEISLEEEAVG